MFPLQTYNEKHFFNHTIYQINGYTIDVIISAWSPEIISSFDRAYK